MNDVPVSNISSHCPEVAVLYYCSIYSGNLVQDQEMLSNQALVTLLFVTLNRHYHLHQKGKAKELVGRNQMTKDQVTAELMQMMSLSKSLVDTIFQVMKIHQAMNFKVISYLCSSQKMEHFLKEYLAGPFQKTSTGHCKFNMRSTTDSNPWTRQFM